MTDKTGIDIVKVHINGGGIEADLWYAHCVRCGWDGEKVFKEDGARKDKVDHVFARCLATSGAEPTP